MRRRINFGVVLLSVLVVSSQQTAKAEHMQMHADAISGSIVVNAAPHLVFEAIKKSRYEEPGRRRVVATDDTSAVLEENFKNLPLIGDAVCRYKEVEFGKQRIEYQIMTSDKFKHFDGAWEVEPINGGSATRLKLSSYVEAYLRVPFAKQLTSVGTKKDIKRRLNHVKESAEQHRLGHVDRQRS